MNDRPTTPEVDPGEHGAEITSALRHLEAPQHGYGFWADLEARFAAEPMDVPTTVVPPIPPLPPLLSVPPPPPPPPPLAELVPLPSPRSGPRWWLAGAAALLVVALGIAALVGTTSTDVRSTTAATVPVVPDSLPAPTTAPATTVSPVTTTPTTARAVPTSAPPRPSTTARTASLTLSPDGLGPLRLGMTHGAAMASGAVGRFEDPLDTGGQCGYAGAAGDYKSDDFSSLYLNGRLARIYAGPRLRTPQGIGVGSPVSKLATVPGTRVESPHPYDDPANPTRTNVDITSGDAGYQFTIENDKVVEWSMGTKEGLSLIEACA